MNKLLQFDPFADFEELQKHLFGDHLTATRTVMSPRADIYVNNSSELVGEFQLPGFKEDEIDVNVHKNYLEVRAEHEDNSEENKGKRYVVREAISSFYRRVRLPHQANEDEVTAHFDNGILKVTVPFKDLPKPKNIKINAKPPKLLGKKA